MSIEIELKLFVTLSQYLPDNSEKYLIQEDMTIDMLINELEIPIGLVKLVFISGKREEMDYLIASGDRVGLFRPVGGG